MNLSLRNRVAASFIMANLVILLLGFIVFHFLDSMQRDMERIVTETKNIAILSVEVRNKLLPFLKLERKLQIQGLTNENVQTELVKELMQTSEELIPPLQELETVFQGVEGNKVINQLINSINNIKILLTQFETNRNKNLVFSDIADYSDQVFDAVFDFQTTQSTTSAQRDEKIHRIIVNTKKNMMYTLIITFIGTMLLGLVIPGKIALPFKKINDAIRELQDCNFDVSIYYRQDDEIGELAREMNKMISSFKKFEELRADRIMVETRKFDALANMVHMNVLVANAKGELIYMNNRLYSFLQLQSDDIIYKNMRDTRIPVPIVDIYSTAIKRRSKIESVEIVFSQKKAEMEDDLKTDNIQLAMAEPLELNTFHGYATVIPIRGKESSLDYYLMVLSEEVIV